MCSSDLYFFISLQFLFPSYFYSPLIPFLYSVPLCYLGVSKSEEKDEADKWLDPYSLANRGIFASYLSVGFGLYFLLTPLTFYMVSYGV